MLKTYCRLLLRLRACFFQSPVEFLITRLLMANVLSQLDRAVNFPYAQFVLWNVGGFLHQISSDLPVGSEITHICESSEIPNERIEPLMN